MAKRCDFCFQEKTPLMPVLPKVNVEVCKACSYKLQQVIGFLEYNRIHLVYQGDMEISPKSPRPKKEALNSSS